MTDNKIRFGVFGAWRGKSFVDNIQAFSEDAVVVAVCDSDTKRIDILRAQYGDKIKYFSDFDEFIDRGIDCVVLCNYFTEHTPYAIKAMEKGIDVISECTSAITLGECVRLCEAVENTGRKYMIAENYPFTKERLEMARLAREGILGEIVYAEGEYNHPAPVQVIRELTPGSNHWRAWIPITYYVTHAFGPLIYMTGGAMPLTVNARAVHSDYFELPFRHNNDILGMMFCQMDNGALFRFPACTKMPGHNAYRIVGLKGMAECGRAVPDGFVYRCFNDWEIPDGMCEKEIYKPREDEIMEKAAQTGHGGGDYFMIYNMIRAIKYDEPIFFDVYKGVAMSAVGILGWRSIIHDGATYHIPDFRDKAARAAVADDELSPIPDNDGNPSGLPCSMKEARERGYIV